MRKPRIKQIKRIDYPQFVKLNLDNHIPVFLIPSTNTDAVKIELVFKAGRYYEKDKVVARMTAAMLREGTKQMNSRQLSETIDYHGASVACWADMDYATIQANFLIRFFEPITEILLKIVEDSIFPEDELQNSKIRNIEKLKIELSKNEVIAFRNFTEKIFGENHNYGYSSDIKDFEAVKREQLLDHYQSYYTPNRCTIFITGNIGDTEINKLNKLFGSMKRKNSKTDDPIISANQIIGTYYFNNDRPYQTAIKIGKKCPGRGHVDYPGFFFLNTILGGYFGSRLSDNIRESKGYTYGIYSGIESYRYDNCFSITTEVGNEYLDQTLIEIDNELLLLRNEPVPESEMKLVRNYLKGYFLSMFNGNLKAMSLIKTMELNGLGKVYFDDFVRKIEVIRSSELQELAIKYLDPQEMVRVIVGNKMKSNGTMGD